MKKLLLALLFAGGAVAAEAEEARLLRFPATNGRDVVFTYAGDLYRVPITGGEATRLTSHVGTEMFARFSPDESRLPSRRSMMAIPRYILCPRREVSPSV